MEMDLDLDKETVKHIEISKTLKFLYINSLLEAKSFLKCCKNKIKEISQSINRTSFHGWDSYKLQVNIQLLLRMCKIRANI